MTTPTPEERAASVYGGCECSGDTTRPHHELCDHCSMIREIRAAVEAEASRWATGICSAHQRPEPDCRVCNGKVAAVEAEQERCVRKMRDAGAAWGLGVTTLSHIDAAMREGT